MPKKPLTDAQQLAKLHIVLMNHLGDIKHAASHFQANRIKRGVRTLDNTTDYLGRALLSIAIRQGMPKAVQRKIKSKLKVRP